MLQSMRERMQGVIAVGIVAIICLTFALWGIQNYLQSRGNLNVVAKVNGVKITRSQLNSAYERARQQAMAQKTAFMPKKEVLERLIKAQVFFEEANKLGLKAGQKQIESLLVTMPAFQVNGRFSTSRFQQILSAMLYTETDFFAELERDIIVNQLETGIMASAFVLPGEVKQIIGLKDQTRDVTYTVIPASRFNNKVTITPQEIKQYYQQHQQQFTIPERVSISYLRLQASNLKWQGKLNDKELLQYYNDNIDLYSHPARFEIVQKNSKKKPGNGEVDFSDVHPVWLIRGQVPANFLARVQKLKPGETSAPFKTANGWSIIKLINKEDAVVKPFSAVKAGVKQALEREKLTELFDHMNDQLSNLTYTSSNTLQVAAKALHLPIETTPLFTRKGGAKGLTAKPKIIKAAFSDTVLRQNYNSDPIEIGANDVVVLRSNKHLPVSVKPLAKVTTYIKQQLSAQKAQEKSVIFGKNLVAKINQGIKTDLKWQHVAQAKRNSKVPEEAFAMQASGKVSGFALDNNQGYAIIKVNKIYPGSTTAFTKEQLAALHKQLALVLGQDTYNLYLNELVKNADVKKPV